jgi:phosphoenolpyruvate carboxylase
MNTTDYLSTGFAHIDEDLAFLIGCFQEVLIEMGQPELGACLPWANTVPSLESSIFPQRAGQAFAVAFQLLNMVEENAAAQTRRVREANEGLLYERGLWGHSLQRLQDHGLDAQQISETMRHVRVEPVLTAHPTEAKRLAVLEAHRALFRLLEKRENPIWTAAEQEAIRDEIKATLERIWRTGEILLEKPDVADERRNVLHYLRHVFPTVLPHIDLRLQQAWRALGFDADLISEPGHRPQLHFGTWVGGDRDGHPFVTARVTQETLGELRLNALLLLRQQLSTLAERLSLSSHVQPPSDALMQAIEARAVELGERGERVLQTHREEPWRQFVELALAKLPLQLAADQSAAIYQEPGLYRYSREVRADLTTLRDSLRQVGANRIAEAEVVPVMRTVEIFGFHLASLDIRQNSRFHDIALSQIMVAAGLDGSSFAEWPEAARLRFLNEELFSTRPFLHADATEYPDAEGNGDIGNEADAVLSSYRVLARHIREYGSNGLGALIVSMTRNLSDLLVVYLLAREAGLAVNTPHGLVCRLPVVPLFETLDDLQRGPDILRAFLEHPMTRRSLLAQSKDGKTPMQQVMVGYSDSNKDAGIFASQWGLHRAQTEMTHIGRECGVQIRFFHGRGGTVSRGAGPTHRFLEALPHGSLSGDMRLTEQGETFAQKYANLSTATYNLELLLAGVTETTVRHEHLPDGPRVLETVAEKMANWSCESYQNLLRSDGFMAFYRAATPIDALECSRIGSRPARRTGQATLADLRAIPWVFSWNQARFYLPSWYGVGTALERLSQEEPQSFQQLTEQIASWPFLRYVLTNVETTLASADLGLMREYSQMVDDRHLRTQFMTLIEAEFKRTTDMLDHLFGRTSQTRRPRMWKTLQLRAEALRRLHMQQIALLRQWREYSNSGNSDAADAMLPQLLLSINAIASGLRTTG